MAARHAGRAAAGIAIVLVAQLMIVLDATVVNVALPRIDEDLGFGPASLSWVLNAYTLAFGGLLLLGGRLGDIRGRLRLFEIGLAIFTVFSLLGGLAQTPGQLVTARALQGVGAALLRACQRDAMDHGHDLSLTVHCRNPALKLYRRCGFREIGLLDEPSTGPMVRMGWSLPRSGARASRRAPIY